jgi:hypothetical protein
MFTALKSDNSPTVCTAKKDPPITVFAFNLLQAQ